MKNNIVWVLLFSVCLVGCTTTQKDSTIGGLGGAVIGGIIGHQSGHGAEGALIGGTAGAAGGVAVGSKRSKKFCPTCGTYFTADKEFCPYDGTKLQHRQ